MINEGNSQPKGLMRRPDMPEGLSVERNGQVTQMNEKVAQEARSLHQLLQVLHEKLQPILRSPAPDSPENEKGDPARLVGVASLLRDHATSIANASSFVGDMIDRLEL